MVREASSDGTGRRRWAGPARRRPDTSREEACHANGIAYVAGIDEAGRGPIAGPVCAAAVILDPAAVPDSLDDSKRLAPSRREALFDAILASAEAAAIGFAAQSEIDALNIREATHLAMRRALRGLGRVPDYVLVDGNDLPAGFVGAAVIGGDGASASIAAASILAKVARDRLMCRAAVAHPQYGFVRHVGYPTREHLEALARHGVCPLHRRSFAPVAKLLADRAGPRLSEKSTARIDQP